MECYLHNIIGTGNSQANQGFCYILARPIRKLRQGEKSEFRTSGAAIRLTFLDFTMTVVPYRNS